MKLKEGVSLVGMQPQVIMGVMIADHIYNSNGLDLTVTSITDSKHGVKSLHYKGLAFDLRTKNINDVEDKKIVHAELKEALGNQWDVILEDLGGPNEHIHCEFDPKVNS